MAATSTADVMTMAAATPPPTPAPTITTATPSQPHTPTATTPRQMASMYLLDLYNSSSNIVDIIAPTDEPDPNVSVELIPCPICSRTFNPITLQKHVGICEKMATKKRNIFDSSRQRREGTELASYPLPKSYGLPGSGSSTAAAGRAERGQSPKPQQLASPILTRKKSQDEFARSTARTSMRKRSNSTNSGAHTPTTPTATSSNTAYTQSNNINNAVASGNSSVGGGHFTRDRMRSSERSLAKRIQPPAAEQCPHCDRCFGIKAYDRHVEWCKEKALQASIKQGSKIEQNVAKERLEARTKYRAPCLKTKRSINREKYSGFTGDENETTDSPKSVNSNHLMSLSMTSSITSDRNITIPGNINEASSYKMKYRGENNNNNNSHTVTENAMQSDVDKRVPGSEDFHIMGEKLATCGRKKQKQQQKQQKQQRKETANKNVHAGEFGNPTYKASSILAADQTNVKSNKCEEIAARQGGGDTHSIDLSMFANDRSDCNALSTILTLRPCDSVTSLSSAATAAADTSKYSATSITRRKLKTKQKSTINLTHTMAEKQQQQQQQQQNVALKSPSSSADALRTLTPQRMSQQQAIFEIPATATSATTTAATKTATTTLHTKLEINPIKSPAICRPKRKKLTRQPSAAAHATPLKAIPLLKESIETFGMPSRELHATRTHFDYDDKEIKVVKAVRSVRPTTPPPPPLERNRSFILSGLPANYDPFLSAKRQLEELCSPISPTDPLEALHTPKTSNSLHTPTTPTTPNMPSKMSTSLTLSTSIPSNSSPLATSNATNRMPNAATPKTPTPTSNFRRASSLRGPRRSPLLPSRPLFAQKPRPTIQRGLSDEGPISSNFLKPEEYDEMPVRAVCVNDFAVTKSPRVVRRDTSNSNRKQSLKLNISPSAAVTTPPPTALPHSNDERLLPDAKYLSKTDSLAVFLKYENELEKLGGAAAVKAATAAVAPTPAAAAAVSVSKPALEHSPLSTPVANLNSPVITKELKDKSNNLSKQNSAKSIKLESSDPPEKRGEELQQLATAQLSSAVGREPLPKQNSEHTLILSNKHTAIRLEPISKPATPLSTPGTNNTTPYTLAARSALPSMSTPLPVVSQTINLNAIFGEQKPQMHSFGKERSRHSNSGEYIDPKLINKCDNLPVSLRTLKASDSDSYERRQNDTSSSCSESSAPASASAAPVSQLCKLLPLSKVTQQQSHYKHNDRMTPTVGATPAQPNAAQQAAQTAALPLAPRNSAEGRHLLKRKMRLGRNQFLYDASPEADSCSADDEANRSSAEYDGQKFQQVTYNSQLPPAPLSQSQSAMHPTRSRPAPLQTPTAHNIPTLPIFDDFDFEEFLSSFEHDDEQFPLFKDCREFLLNRTSNKQRSTPTANSNAGSGKQPTPEKHLARQSPFQHDSFLGANTHTSAFPASHTHFQFPNVISKPLLTSSSLRSHSNSVTLASKEPSLQSPKYDARFYDDDNLAAANGEQLGKREIFISIETEQNDLSRSPISPDSLRSMVGNPQAMVEVEVDANDNKFSRISDDEPLPPTPTSSQLSMAHGTPFGQLQHLPNVQLNNAKNLIQKMQDDFRQMSEEVGANIRQTVVTGSTLPRSSTAGGTSRSALSGATNNVSGELGVDSDDMSSLDGYPISSQSSRRGVVSKLSADSAYGSLSRQRSSDISTHRSQSRTRPSTASASTNTAMPASRTADAATQHQQQQLPQQQQPHYKYMTTKSRSRQFSGSSSSGSDNSLPPIATHNHSHNLNAATCNSNYQQQQQQLSQHYNNNNNGNGNGISGNNNNNSNCESPLSSPTGGGGQTAAPASTTTIAALHNDANANLSHASSRSNSISSSAMSTSLNKMSKFCHECGSRFIIEHAKFCTDCGVRRIVI